MSRFLDTSTTTQMAKIMVQYWRPSCSSWAKSVWSSFGRTVMGKAIWENPIAARLRKGFQKVNAYSYREKGLFLSVYVDDIILAGKKQNLDPMWELLMEVVDLGEPTSFLDHVYLGCSPRECETGKDTVENDRNMFESGISEGATEKLPCSGRFDANLSTWSYDMEGHAKKCVERYCELANRTTQQFFKVGTPCVDDHQIKEEETGSVGELPKCCSQIVLKYLHLARSGRPDILWSVNKLARAITKWTRACDKRLARLISYVRYTSEFKQYCHVGQQCRLGLFQDSDFAGDLEDSTSTSGALMCMFWTCVPTSWMCNKQTSVSHSSTESEIISLDASLRMDGIPALDLWDLVIEVFHSSSNKFTENPKWEYRETCHVTHHQASTPTSKPRILFSTTILDYAMSIMLPQTWSLLNFVRCSTSL